MNRRQFLKGALAGGAAIALAGTGYKLFETDKKSKWDFLKPEAGEFPDDYADVVEQKYPRFGRSVDLSSGIAGGDRSTESMWKLVEPQIIGSIKECGKKVSDFEAKGTMKTYGVPLEEEVASQHKDFVEIAEQFLRDRVKGLTSEPVIWTPVKYGEDYSEDFKGKGFLGKGYFSVANVYAEDKDGFRITPHPVATKLSGCGLVKPDFDRETGKVGDWYMFLGAGPSSFILPASEIIPLSTISKGIELKDKSDVYIVKIAEEAISEGISHILAEEMVSKYGIPDGKKALEDALKFMGGEEMYMLVPKSVGWIRKNGVQQAFDLYMDDPRKYLAAILGKKY